MIIIDRNSLIFIVSANPEFSNLLSSHFKPYNTKYANSVSEIQNKIDQIQNNYIVIDVESVNDFIVFANLISNKRNVFLILTGKKVQYSTYATNIKILLKPFLNNEFFNKRYSEDLINLMETFVDKIRIVQTNFRKVIAIASSTGGTEAIEKIFLKLPVDCPPILVVQHMPKGFTEMFANRLNNICNIEVKEAQSGDKLRKGLVLIAPGDFHMVVEKKYDGFYSKCFVGQKINGLMPAADILFDSVADVFGSNAVGVILTGMGGDGSEGLLKMKQKGAKTIGQNKETSVIYGMAQSAKKLNAIDIELPLEDIGKGMLKFANE